MQRRFLGFLSAITLVACGGATTGPGGGGEGGVDAAQDTASSSGGSSGAGGSSSGSSGGSSSGPGGEAGSGCTATGGCATGQICGFPTADACSAQGTCFPAPGATCLVYSPGCACDGTEVNVACTGLPSGYATQPLLHTGGCP